MTRKEYNVLSFYLTRLLFIGSGFPIMIDIAKNNSILCGILGLILGYFILFIAHKGRISNIVNLFICLIVILIGVLGVTSLSNTYLLFETPSLIIIGILIMLLLYGSSKSMQNIGWMSFVTFIVSSFVIIVACISLFKFSKVCNLMPMFNTNICNFIKGVLVFAGTATLPNLLLINYKNDMKFKDISIGYVAASLLMILVLFFILGIYGYEFASYLRFPEYAILRNIDIMGVITNIENVLILEWISCIIISLMVSFRVLRDIFDKKVFYIFIVLFILGIYFVLIKTNYVNTLIIKNYINYIYIFICVIALVIRKRQSS